jgi:hypothetical protein
MLSHDRLGQYQTKYAVVEDQSLVSSKFTKNATTNLSRYGICMVETEEQDGWNRGCKLCRLCIPAH